VKALATCRGNVAEPIALGCILDPDQPEELTNENWKRIMARPAGGRRRYGGDESTGIRATAEATQHGNLTTAERSRSLLAVGLH
jgi:hypothetical protein